jgi:hypothetical protein
MKFNLKLLLAFAVLALTIASCKKDVDSSFGFSELTANGINLNGASSATGVPRNATITAKFSTNVDVTTATTANIKLKNTFDNSDVAVAVSAVDNVVTIKPVNDLGDGSTYELSLSSGLKGTNGTAFTAATRTFKTGGTFAPSGIIAHWTFENNADDVVGTYDPKASGIVALSYVDSRNAAAGKAASFDGDATIIEIPNGDLLLNSKDFSISFWVKTNSSGHVNENGDPSSHFVMGLGAFKGFQFEVAADYSSCKLAGSYELADGTTASEDLWFPGNGQDKDNGGWQGWDYVKDLTGSGGVAGLLKDKWAHVVCVYDGTTKKGTMYINGDKMKSQDFNLWPAGDAKQGVKGMKYGGVAPEVVNELAFGFIQSRAGTLWDTETWGGYDFPTSNHFKGALDDVKIWHKPLSSQEVKAMYDSEK